MSGSARIGQFAAPTGAYGGFVAVVRPANNVVVSTVAQQVFDAAARANADLLAQLKAAQASTTAPPAPILASPVPPDAPYQITPLPPTTDVALVAELTRISASASPRQADIASRYLRQGRV